NFHWAFSNSLVTLQSTPTSLELQNLRNYSSPIRRVEVKVGMMRDSIEKFGHNRKVQEQILEFWMFVEQAGLKSNYDNTLRLENIAVMRKWSV
ncbi:hypothetical protein COW20_08690, partial [bacterium (Candidatus Blackallbacteria) CG13_big_fil_rev_8_21_14_2_50_49_14]